MGTSFLRPIEQVHPCHQEFSAGFKLIEKGDFPGGLAALRSARAGWLDRPVRLVRAARHYEGLVQLLVRQTVLSAQAEVQVDLSSVVRRPELGREVRVRCPARLDLSGGWTDTPPICYELGGKVVDLAITLDGDKPIGCKVRRVEEPHVEILLDDGELIFVKTRSDLDNHCSPTAKGALVKCCLLAAGVLELDSGDTVAAQLVSRVGAGLRLELWSALPQGSGLGTSSILAGAVVAACWAAVGCSWSRRSVVHAVLVVEQLLTTGGGWQDQVGGLYPGVQLGTSPANHQVNYSTLMNIVLTYLLLLCRYFP